MRSVREAVGTKVIVCGGEKQKTVGEVKHVLFAPEENRVVGFEVRRPDVAMAYQRKPLYLALDRTTFAEDAIEVSSESADAWGSRAARRLGIDWARTVIWQHMDAESQSGEILGTVDDGVFDEKTGELNAVRLSRGAVAAAATGVRDIPARLVLGFDGAAVRLSDEATKVEATGGVAKPAGKAAAGAVVMADQIGDAAMEGIDDLAVKTGKAAGQAIAATRDAAKVAANTKTGKRAMGWLKSIRDEVVDAMGPGKDDK